MHRFATLLISGAFLVGAGAAQAGADLEREQRLYDEIVDAIIDGDPVDLNDGKRDFLGIYTETDADTPKGAVLVLHGRGFHPDWADVVQPLRVGLTEEGWASLSLQMPVLEKQAKYYDYVPVFPEAHARIDAGLRYLREQGYERVVLIAHSCGAHMAMSWIDEAEMIDLQGYIGIGMGATDYKQKMAKPFPIDKLQIPVLDVYGEKDFPAVLRMAADRKAAQQNPASRQVAVEGAEHYFKDKGDELVEVVSDWLNGL